SQSRYLRFSQLSTVGVHAVMVASEAVLKDGLPAEEIRELDGSLPGRAVVTERGQRLGEVAGFAVNTSTGRIESYRVRPDAAGLARLASLVKPELIEIPDALVVSLGANALIVRDDATTFVHHDAREHAPHPPEETGGTPSI